MLPSFLKSVWLAETQKIKHVWLLGLWFQQLHLCSWNDLQKERQPLWNIWKWFDVFLLLAVNHDRIYEMGLQWKALDVLEGSKLDDTMIADFYLYVYWL